MSIIFPLVIFPLNKDRKVLTTPPPGDPTHPIRFIALPFIRCLFPLVVEQPVCLLFFPQHFSSFLFFLITFPSFSHPLVVEQPVAAGWRQILVQISSYCAASEMWECKNQKKKLGKYLILCISRMYQKISHYQILVPIPS